MNMKFNEIKSEIKGLKKIGEGWRGVIYKGELEGKVLSFKVPKSEIHTTAIKKEGKILRYVNQYGIGGKLILEGDDFIAYEYIDGHHLKDILSEKNYRYIFQQLLEQSRTLDRLSISKDEMHRPHKNVLVDKDLKVYLIDFERAKKTKNLQNVTQLLQFFLNEGSNYFPKLDRDEIIKLSVDYKKNMDENTFLKIKDRLGL